MAVASANGWLLTQQSPICCPLDLHITQDGGATWYPVQIASAENAELAGAAADGSFRVVARIGYANERSEYEVVRVDASGTVTPLGPPIVNVAASSQFRADAVSEDGSTWIPYRSAVDESFRLAIIAADGSLSEAPLPQDPQIESWRARNTSQGMRLLAYGQRLLGTYTLSGGQVVPAGRYPIELSEGDFKLSAFYSASWDGGAHWGEFPARPVPRAPGLGAPRYLLGRRFAVRYSSFLYRRTMLGYPPEGIVVGQLVDAGSKLITWTGEAIYIYDGDLPQMPLSIGAIGADTERLMERADQLRAEAELPPLIADAQLSEAARNYSRYTALNGDMPPHLEAPGKPGFTGVEPWDRCEAVGTSCDAEITYSSGEPDPVAEWLATPFHRPLLGSPVSGVVGAAKVDGGDAVMDLGSEAVNILTRPYGYPRGIWRGPGQVSGEIPDPVEVCNQNGQSISYPIGIAVTLYTPVPSDVEGGEVTHIQVRKAGTSDDLPGCLLHQQFVDSQALGSFFLDEPLSAGQTYDVQGEWNTGVDRIGGNETLPGVSEAYSWSFTYEGSGNHKSRKHRLRRIVRVKWKRGQIIVRGWHFKKGHIVIRRKILLKKRRRFNGKVLARARVSVNGKFIAHFRWPKRHIALRVYQNGKSTFGSYSPPHPSSWHHHHAHGQQVKP